MTSKISRDTIKFLSEGTAKSSVSHAQGKHCFCFIRQRGVCLVNLINFILSVYLVNENRSYLHDIKRQEGGLSMNLKMKKVIN